MSVKYTVMLCNVAIMLANGRLEHKTKSCIVVYLVSAAPVARTQLQTAPGSPEALILGMYLMGTPRLAPSSLTTTLHALYHRHASAAEEDTAHTEHVRRLLR